MANAGEPSSGGGVQPPATLRAEEVVDALHAAAERDDRVAAIELYRRYEAGTAALGETPDDRVVEAYRGALWRPQPKVRAEDVLPRPGTPYFGRVRETARVADLLRAPGALVTLSGLAGVGKTRLALAAAERVRSAFADDVRYVELHAFDDLTALFARAADAENLQTLLVVDNAEPVLDDARAAIERFRAAHPRSSVLVTSRIRLGVRREAVVDVAPFALPLTEATAPVIARTPAIAFFVERAVLARPDFHYDDRFAEDLAQLCVSLDGLPLALELAAAQLRFFSLRELTRRVALADFAPTSLEATLQVTIELLDRDERRLFHRLAVFEAPWTVAEAEAVCGGDGLDAAGVLPAMVRLLERSLLQTETRDHVVRYRFLETVRRVALGGDEADRGAARARAVRWYMEQLLAPGLDGIPDTATTEVLGERHAALCCVLDRWCDDPSLVLRAIASTRKYWEWRGAAAESLGRIEAHASALDGADEALAFAVARTIATHALAIGDNDRAARGIERMLALAEPRQDEARLIEAWHNGAILAYNTGRLDETVTLLERVAALQTARNMDVDRARTVMNLAAVDLARRDWVRAEGRLASIAHVNHGRNEAVFVARNRAYAAAMRGELVAARSFAADAKRRCADPAVGLEWRVEVEHALGVIAFQAGDWYGAIRHQQLALLVAPRLPLRLAALPLEHAALAALKIARPEEAAQLLGYVDEQRRRAGLRRSAAFEAFFCEERAAIAAALGGRVGEHITIGASLATERAAEIAFSLPTQGPQPDALRTLSNREREVADLIAEGATNREIAERLVISVKTVENHLASVFGKLEVTRRAHVGAAVRAGRPASGTPR